MGLFSRSGGVTVVVSPGIVTPRQTVQATVTTDKPIDKVRSARLDWGYANFYQYHWAGKVDSVAAAGNDTIWTADQVGTNYGGDRDTDDWVSVIAEELPIATGEFTGATSNFRIPSWAPASSPSIARWECRLTVDRSGRDVDTRGEFTVAIGTADVESYTEPLERISGAAETVIDITLSKPVWRAGETITGRVTLNPTMDLPDGDLAVSWQRDRESHPLTRAPGPGGQLDGRIVTLGKRIPLPANVPVVCEFEIPLPEDAPPTAAAVHSSINWFVQARMMYAGFNGHQLERVRRPIVVVNAP
ncbi:hypothetical protein [Mycolicibacterium hodleri]|uniref:Arrestin-like N-terminal domain-containing protein n=1 Tax=Mycolicibacterium hodleri TaxID=49897 RepID=A0A502EDN7_9MYCO|nr:hypothetical protein [Mycolicibacterium hodleri]TPG35788.1 hypothetical protein EAH80_06950 [Mycolicibacterium hodleri]